MAPRSSGANTKDPFKVFCEDLSNALQNQASVVKLPKKTIHRIERLADENKENKPVFSWTQIRELVSIIDSDLAENVCVLFHEMTFVAILQILLLSERCRAVERGFYLLMATLHQEKTAAKSPQEFTTLEEKMAIIGKATLHKLLDSFTAEEEDDHARVWIGLLLIVLFKECKQNQDELASAPSAIKRKLGTLITEQDDELVRIVCGKLLGAIRKANLKMQDFWPANVKASLYSGLPMSQDDVAWNQAYQEWLDSEMIRPKMRMPEMDLEFAQSVQTIPAAFEELDRNLDLTIAFYPADAEGIFEMSLYAQGGGNTCDRRMDIPMNLISGLPVKEPVILAPGPVPDVPPNVYVVIPLRQVDPDSEEEPCYINSKICLPEQIREVRMRVKDNDNAEFVLDCIKKSMDQMIDTGRMEKYSQESNKSKGIRTSSQPLQPLRIKVTAETDSRPDDSSDELPDFANLKIKKLGQDQVDSIKGQNEQAATTAVKNIQPEANFTPGGPRRRLAQGGQNPSPRVQTPFHKMGDLGLQSDDNSENIQGSLVNEMNENSKSQDSPHVSPPISRPRGTTETPSPDPIAGLGLAVDNETPSPDISQHAEEHQSEHRQGLSVDNGTTQTRSDPGNSESPSRQAKSGQRTTAKETEIVASLPSREAKAQPRKGRSSQTKPVKEVDRRENDSEEQITTEDGDKASGALRDQNPPEEPAIVTGKNSASQKTGVGKSQPRTSLPTGGKGKGTSGGSGRAKPNEPEAMTFEDDADDLTSPEPQDASTPKTAQNVALRAKNPQAIDKQNEPVANLSNVPKEASIRSKTRPPPAKKYSLKPKPAISVAKPVAKATGRGKTVGQSDAHQDSQVKAKESTISKDTQAKAKSTTQSSNSSKPKEKAATTENERDVFDMPSDDEEDPKDNKVNRKAAVKATKSKGSKTSAKTTAKKAATKKKQPASEGVNDNVAPRRSQRQAAAAATSKMSQISFEADAEDYEEAEKPRPRQPAAIEKKHRSPVRKTQTKAPDQTPTQAPARGKESSILRAKVGIGARKAVTKNEPSKMEASKVSGDKANSNDKMNSPPEEEDIFQQLQEDAFELNLAHEPPDGMERISNSGTPTAQGPENRSKKRRSNMAATLKGMLGGMELDNGKEEDGHISYKDRLQKPDLLPEGQGPSRVSLDEQRRESSALRISPSPEVQSTLQNKGSNPDGGATQETTSQKSVAVPDERDGSDYEPSASKRRRLNVQPAGPSAASKCPNKSDSKSKKAMSKAVKASTPPLRRRPRLNSPGVEESGVLRSAMKPNDLVNEKLSRKTPIIAFGKNGPRNQGLSSAKSRNAQQQEETPTKSQTTEKASLAQPKRKRDDKPEIGELIGRPHKRVDSKQYPTRRLSQEHNMAKKDMRDIPAMVKEHDMNEPQHDESIFPDPGTPKSDTSSPGSIAPPKRATKGEILVLRSSPFNFEMPVQQSSPSRMIPIKTSKVNDNGSPIKSSTPLDRVKALQGLVQQQEEELRYRGHQMDEVDILPAQTIAESPIGFEPLSSNIKARPAAPGAERGQYIPHRETGEDKYEDMTSEKVVHMKRFTEDPFAGGPSRRKPSSLTERFMASRSGAIDKSVVDVPLNLTDNRSQPIERSIIDTPVNLMASGSQPLEKHIVDMPVKPKRHFRSDNDKNQVTDSVEEKVGDAKAKPLQLSKPTDIEAQLAKSVELNLGSVELNVEMAKESEPVKRSKPTNNKVIMGKNSVMREVMKDLLMAKDEPQRPNPTNDKFQVAEHVAENDEVANDEHVQHAKPANNVARLVEDLIEDLRLAKDEPVQNPEPENTKTHLIEHFVVNFAVVQDKPAERSQSASDGRHLMKQTVLVVDEEIKSTDAADEQTEAQPESSKPTLRSETIQTRVEKSQEVIMDGPVKRNISFEIEQEDDNSQKKRRKTTLEVQKWNSEVEDEGHFGIQHPIENHLSPAEHLSQGLAEPVFEKPSSQGSREKSGTGDQETQGRTRKRATKLLSMLGDPPQVGPEVISRQPLRQTKTSVEDYHREVIQPHVAESSLELADARPTKSLLQINENKSNDEDQNIHDGTRHLVPSYSQGLVKARPEKPLLALDGDSAEVADEVRQERVHHRVTSHLPRLSRVRSQKPSFQTADTALDGEAAEPKRKPSSKIENRQTRQRAPEEAEIPAQDTNRPTQRRILRERPVAKSTRRPRGEGEDPEKTLVEEHPPPPASSPSSSPSDMTSGSSASSHSGSSAASPTPKELSQEEEWGAQLRSHDRPILQSLYRIVNGLVSHLVDQREAIDIVVEDYEEGGTELIDVLETNQQIEKDDITANFESAKTQLTKSYTNAQRNIASGPRESSKSSILVMEKKWREEHDALQSFIAESMEDEE